MLGSTLIENQAENPSNGWNDAAIIHSTVIRLYCIGTV